MKGHKTINWLNNLLKIDIKKGYIEKFNMSLNTAFAVQTAVEVSK